MAHSRDHLSVGWCVLQSPQAGVHWGASKVVVGWQRFGRHHATHARDRPTRRWRPRFLVAAAKAMRLQGCFFLFDSARMCVCAPPSPPHLCNQCPSAAAAQHHALPTSASAQTASSLPPHPLPTAYPAWPPPPTPNTASPPSPSRATLRLPGERSRLR